MKRFEFCETPITGLIRVQRTAFQDERGYFSRFFCAQEFRAAGWCKEVVQINDTLTRNKGALRGMHFQKRPSAEMKLVSCVRGEIFDTAVDIRKNSPTFLRWHGEFLSDSNRHSLIIPEGFAHGFQALTNDCQLIYLHTAAYDASSEGGLNAADPRLSIEWPLEITEISSRDRAHPMLTDAFTGIEV